MHISPYEKGNIFNRDPVRERKLLLHRREINRLLGQIKQEGLTLIPISVYFKGSKVKVQLGLCKGKKLHDKRASAAERDAKRSRSTGRSKSAPADKNRAHRGAHRGAFMRGRNGFDGDREAREASGGAGPPQQSAP